MGKREPGLPLVLEGVEGKEWIPAFPAPSLLTWSLGCIVESEPRTLGSLRRLPLASPLPILGCRAQDWVPEAAQSRKV